MLEVRLPVPLCHEADRGVLTKVGIIADFPGNCPIEGEGPKITQLQLKIGLIVHIRCILPGIRSLELPQDRLPAQDPFLFAATCELNQP
jgi:hypothetical protein